MTGLLLCLTFGFISAQNITITGTVTDASTGEPIPYAAVLIKGTQIGRSADELGKYSVSAPGNSVLIFSFIGYETKEVNVNGRAKIDVTLAVDAVLLDDAIVIGYGSGQRIANVIGSHVSVENKAIISKPSPNVMDALQGKVVGMQSWVSSGEPTASASIRIRGVTSANMSNEPLYLLDGVAVTSSMFNQLNSYDIENVTVLKDAVSTGIYGARAANGVVYVTTKRGKRATAPRVSFNAFYGVAFNTNTKLDLMNSEELLAFEAKRNPDLLTKPEYQAWRNLRDEVTTYGINFDWEDYVFKSNAPTLNANVEVSGGSDNSRYLFSLGYYKKEGTSIRSDMERFNIRMNVDSDIAKWLRIGANIGMSLTNAEEAVTGWYTNSPSAEVFTQPPYYMPWEYTIEGGKVVTGKKYSTYPWSSNFDQFDYFAHHPSVYEHVTLSGNVFQELKPIKGLTLKAVQSIDGFDRVSHSKRLPRIDTGHNYGTAYVSEGDQRRYTLTSTNTIDYRHSINNNHNLSYLLGHESTVYYNESNSTRVSGQTDRRLMLLTNGDATTAVVGHSISEYVFNSFFFKADYDYNSKYYLSGSVRRDGSSRFGSGNKWGNFFAIGGMWDIKKEGFLSGVKEINSLRFRANYGHTGNANLGDYAWRASMASSGKYANAIGLGLSAPGNVNLTWETIKNLTIGFDSRLFNRVDLNIEWYNKLTDDMLMDVPYSAATGFSSGSQNVGKLRNRGVEIEASVDLISRKNFYWGVSANVSYNKNTIVELFNGLEEYTQGTTGLKLVVGKPIGSFSVVRRVGVDPQDGNLVWLDADGELTKEWSDANETLVDMNQYADWTGGFGTQFTWKNLSFFADFSWCGPKYLWLNEHLYTRSLTRAAGSTNYERMMLNIWTEPGQITDVPRSGTPFYFDTSVYNNAAFLRLKNISISYSFPKALTDKINVLKGGRIYATGRNLLTFTNFTGLDPEVDSNGSQFRYPNSREIIFGIEFTF